MGTPAITASPAISSGPWFFGATWAKIEMTWLAAWKSTIEVVVGIQMLRQNVGLAIAKKCCQVALIQFFKFFDDKGKVLQGLWDQSEVLVIVLSLDFVTTLLAVHKS